jgi:hypothetical protein
MLVAFLSACIGQPLSQATQENVTHGHIVGTWRYSADFGAAIITLELIPNGTFVQTVRHRSGRVQTHEGTWTLDGSRPRLEVLKPVFGEPGKEWVVESAHWWIVESHHEGVRFAVFGAADDSDPDSCCEFEKVH